MLVLFSGVANVTNKTVWAITCVLSSFVVCHIVSVHWFVVTKITFKVRNHFGSMRFHLMIFKGGICSKRFFAHYTLLCPCVLVFDMSTVGAWCQNFLANIASFLFDYLRLHLIFSLVCNIDGRPPRCQEQVLAICGWKYVPSTAQAFHWRGILDNWKPFWCCFHNSQNLTDERNQDKITLPKWKKTLSQTVCLN